MADRLTRRATAGALVALLCSGLAAAQSRLGDPTRPPLAAVVDAAPPGDAVEAVVPVLQSVLLPEKGRARAIITGKQVAIGEMVGDSRLVKLTENEAVLVGPGGSTRLFLTPAVEKTNVTAKPSPSPAGRVKKGDRP